FRLGTVHETGAASTRPAIGEGFGSRYETGPARWRPLQPAILRASPLNCRRLAVIVRVLELARETGLLKLGTAALDGTKIHANAQCDRRCGVMAAPGRAGPGTCHSVAK